MNNFLTSLVASIPTIAAILLVWLQNKGLRELMEEKFKAVDARFIALNDKLDMDKRVTALEQTRSKAS